MAKKKNSKIDLKEWIDTRGTDFVIKVRGGKPYVSRKPKRDPKRKKSDPEQKQVDLFRQAVLYAKDIIADEEKKKPFEDESKQTGRSVYHLAISRYFADNKEKSKSVCNKLEFEDVVTEKSGELTFLKIYFPVDTNFKKLEVKLSELDKTFVEQGTAEQAQVRSWWYLISHQDIVGLPFRALISATTKEDEVFEAEYIVT